MKFNKLITLLFLPLFTLTSCNNNENEEYKYDENKILVKDFAIKDAKKCIEVFSNYLEIKKDNWIFDIYYYLGTYQNNYKLVTISEWEYDFNMHDMGRGVDQDFIFDETVDDIFFEWTIIGEYHSLRKPRLYVDDKCYTVSEAYSLNYLSHDDLLKISDIWNNKRDEYLVSSRFIGKSYFEDAKEWGI